MQDGDYEKILSKDEYSLFKGEPKQPMNAFNFFIKKLSTEQKIDFKSAVQAYRTLSKEEKDVYIEMSRKAKIQYKHDLATYLFSLPPDEQTAYLKKLDAPKRTRVKKEKAVAAENGDTVDDDVVDDEDDDLALQTTAEFDETTIPSSQIEVIATQDSADFDEAVAAAPNSQIEVIDVYIKTEYDPATTNDDLQTSTASNEGNNSTAAATPTPSKSSEKPTKASGSKSATAANSSIEADESTPKKANDSTKRSTPQKTPQKPTTPATDDESNTTTVSEKKKDKAHKRKRKEDEPTEEVVDFENKKIKQEVEEPTRIPS